MDTAFIWALTFVPSLPVLFLYFAFRRVLYAKKFEMRTLLKRGKTLQKYLSAYGGAKPQDTKAPDATTSDALVDEIVSQVFRLRYSGLEYLSAIGFVILVIVLLTIFAFLLAGLPLGLPVLKPLAGNPILGNIVAGGIGALVWSVYELSERYRSADLPPDAFLSMGTRIIVVGAVGCVVGSIVVSRLAWPVAFGVGILPMKTVQAFIAERTRSALRITNPPKTSETPSLDLIQGWNSETSDKLSRAGILSVQELACTNQFQLYLRSNLDWRVILDLSDQALLILYLGKAVENLRPLGIRSAVELAEIDWSDGDDDFYSDLKRPEAIKCIAKALDMDEQAVKLLITSVATDSTVNFLATLWSDATPDNDEDEVAKEVSQESPQEGFSL